ncbi:MAG: hypothetical protein ACREYC_19080, partial [Gammaproteobacteria bacterium]
FWPILDAEDFHLRLGARIVRFPRRCKALWKYAKPWWRWREHSWPSRLKTPYRDGTTHVVFEPLDKIVGNNFEQP